MPISKDSNECKDHEGKSKRPLDSALRQQRLPAWQPVLTASSVIPFFFCVGLAFVPIGVGIFIAQANVQEKSIDYTKCLSSSGTDCAEIIKSNSSLHPTCKCNISFELDTDFQNKVFMYYRLTGFYQNHRRYMKSRDDYQLRGALDDSSLSACKPYDMLEGKPILPCGAIANSMFNDSIALSYLKGGAFYHVGLLHDNIAWPSDRRVKFKNPSDPSVFLKYSKPPNWAQPIENLTNGLENEDFIVWMRTAALSTFRKLYRRVDHVGDFKGVLPKGTYNLIIDYNYYVNDFGGKKEIILSTTTFLGGRNVFLGVAYIVVGCVCIVLGFVFLLLKKRLKRFVPEQEIDKSNVD